MKKVILTVSIFALSAVSIIAQTQATTTDGKSVILNSNGTWQYASAQTEENESPTDDDCSKYLSVNTDKVTGKSTLAAKDMLIVSDDGGKNGFGIYLMKTESETIVFSIQAVGAGSCIDSKNQMNVLFRDGSRIELTNDGKFNCDAKYTQYFGGYFGKEKQLKSFSSKEVETMRIWTSRGYVEQNFDSKQSKELMNTVKCLLKN